MWETWTGATYKQDASWNHIMFGQYSDYAFKYLAGLKLVEGTRGFKQFTVYPRVFSNGTSICQNLSWVDASLITPIGMIRSSWSCGTAYSGEERCWGGGWV